MPDADALAIESELKSALEKLDQSDAMLRSATKSLADILQSFSESPRKGQLRQRLFGAERRLAPGNFPWCSQAGQDRFLDQHIFKQKTNGTFIEVGGYDGVTGSNTLFFERHRQWKGLIIEPSPKWAAKARAARGSSVLQVAAGKAQGRAKFLEVEQGYTQMSGLSEFYDPELRSTVEKDGRFKGKEIEVEIRPLEDILVEHGIVRIDYISLDVEGTEEAVLASFPFDKYDVSAWSVENNTGNDAAAKILSAAGYQRKAFIGVDEIWVRA